MSTRNLLDHPAASPAELGRPIPDSLHAVSVALPHWRDVVGYEEKDDRVISRLQSGYPRFVIHPLVQQIAKRLSPHAPCLPFPSRAVAKLCADYARHATAQAAQIVHQDGLWGVVTGETGVLALRAFWQHTGLIVCSRQAEAWLSGRSDVANGAEIRQELRQALAALYDCAEDDVLLAPTGMAAQYAALRIINQWRPGLPTAQLGFPYVDTLKLQQKLGHGGFLLHRLDRIDKELEELALSQALGACFCEIPGNPLLGSADVRKIAPVLRKHRLPLIVDDVVATPYNIDAGPYAAFIATSLTKFLAGTCDVMGGALICNPASPFYAELKPIARAQHEELLWGEDAAVLARQIRGFPERMRKHNANGLLLAERLRKHPAVEKVWYPKWEFSEAYEAVRRPEGGWGALITFLPKNAEIRAPRIYDALHVCKGPSLGTVFTLACPFTLLAHYSELAWAEACGVSRNLIRISAGLEDPEDLWRRIQAAVEVE